MNRAEKKRIQKIRKRRRIILAVEIAAALLAVAAAVIICLLPRKEKTNPAKDSTQAVSQSTTEESTTPEETTTRPTTTETEEDTTESTESVAEPETDENGETVYSFTIVPTEDPAKTTAASDDDTTESVTETVPEPSETETTEESSESETESTTEKVYEGADYSQVVFIGDSRTLTMGTGGEYAYDLVPMDSIAATWGGQLIDSSAYENVTTAALRTPKKAVFWYGINDVQLNPERGNPEIFIANYNTLISAYLTMYDSSTIYLMSILPTTVREKDYYEGQDENIAAYNQALQQYANEHGYVYLDLSPLFTGDECFAEGDNIHFAKWWYEERFLPAVTRAIGIVY